MKYQWVLSALVILLFVRCSSSIKEQPIGKNVLDKILGDKLLDASTGEIRDNNFMDLIGMEEGNLAIPSKLYLVEKVTEGIYLLKQRKTYTNARRFSILLKTNEGQVIQYELLDDWDVVQLANKEGNIVLLCHNFDYYDDYWIRNQNAMTIMEYDKMLQKQWQYEPNDKSLLIEGLGLDVFSNKIKATINIITGCHICTNEIELELNENGECNQAKEVSTNNSTINFSMQELKNFFVKE